MNPENEVEKIIQHVNRVQAEAIEVHSEGYETLEEGRAAVQKIKQEFTETIAALEQAQEAVRDLWNNWDLV
jgi:hypothetical protein